jgi:hypothetical protein
MSGYTGGGVRSCSEFCRGWGRVVARLSTTRSVVGKVSRPLVYLADLHVHIAGSRAPSAAGSWLISCRSSPGPRSPSRSSGTWTCSLYPHAPDPAGVPRRVLPPYSNLILLLRRLPTDFAPRSRHRTRSSSRSPPSFLVAEPTSLHLVSTCRQQNAALPITTLTHATGITYGEGDDPLRQHMPLYAFRGRRVTYLDTSPNRCDSLEDSWPLTR